MDSTLSVVDLLIERRIYFRWIFEFYDPIKTELWQSCCFLSIVRTHALSRDISFSICCQSLNRNMFFRGKKLFRNWIYSGQGWLKESEENTKLPLIGSWLRSSLRTIEVTHEINNNLTCGRDNKWQIDLHR